jgi:hypothetical protein
MAANALKKITTRAKQIRKKQPGKSWKAAVKQAGAEYRAGKKTPVRRKRKASVGAIKRSPAKRKRSVGTKPKFKVVHEVRRVSGLTYKGGSVKLAGVGSISQTKSVLKRQLGQQAGWLEVMISSAKTKPKKKALRKKKAAIVSELNRLK